MTWTHLQPDDVEVQLWYLLVDATARSAEQLDDVLAQLTPDLFHSPQLAHGIELVRDLRRAGRHVDVPLVAHEARRRRVVLDWLDPIEVSRGSCWPGVVPEYVRILREAADARDLAKLLERALDALRNGYSAAGVAGRLRERLAPAAGAG